MWPRPAIVNRAALRARRGRTDALLGESPAGRCRLRPLPQGRCPTMCLDPRRDPRHCIVPPHMLRVLEMRGDARAGRDGAAAARRRAAEVRERARRRLVRRDAADAGTTGFVAAAFVEAAATREPAPRDPRRRGQGGAAGTAGARRGRSRRPATPHADAAYDGAGVVYDLYFQQLRPRLDRRPGHDAGRRPSTTAASFNNAFWDGTQMAYGDGDGRDLQHLHRDLGRSATR